MTKSINMRTEPKSDQMNYDDFLGGSTKTITITDVRSTESQNDQQPISIHYDGDEGKPYKPCKSMRRVLVDGWGTDGLKYVGKSLTLFGDPNVTWGGQAVGGIRISHLSHIDKPIKSSLTATRGQRKLFVVQPLVIDMGNVEEEVDSDELLIEAREFAKGGKPNFVTWFNTLNQDQMDIVKANMDELQKLCKEADSTSVEDPFKVQPTEGSEPDTSRDQLGETVDKGEPKPGDSANGSPAPIEDVSKWLSRAQIRDAIDDCRTEDELDHLIFMQSLGIKSKREEDQIEINNAVIDRKKVLANV